jgi:histidine ammonia-lyase
MVSIDGNRLSLEEVERVSLFNEPVQIASEAMEKVQKSRAYVERLVRQGATIYGVTTGFGKFSDTKIAAEDVADLQKNLLRSHACGVGEPLSVPVVRAMMLMRLNALAKGFSGIRPHVLKTLQQFLNRQVHPVVPSQGSLGASGDLAPLSHLALTLIGEGEVLTDGGVRPALEALVELGLTPVELTAKEGLALINGTQTMCAIGAIACMRAKKLADLADGIAAMTVEALHGIVDAYSPLVQEVRGYPEQIAAAQNLRQWLEGSGLTTRQGELRVQDAYALRCIPQVHGASRQAIAYAEDKLVIDMNAATDNPLIFVDSEEIISGGNFHGQPVALAMDFMKIGVAELGSISERRIERLVNPQLSEGLRPFLSPRPGLMSGLMITQYVAASLVSENKVLCHPSSVDSIPSSGNQEDHVSMGTTAARHAMQVVSNAAKVLAVEAICAAAAIEERGPERMAFRTRKLYEWIRTIVPPLTEDRSLSREIEQLAEALMAGEFCIKDVLNQTGDIKQPVSITNNKEEMRK